MILRTKKVRDHCHYTGLYQQAANENSNLKYNSRLHILDSVKKKTISTLASRSRLTSSWKR